MNKIKNKSRVFQIIYKKINNLLNKKPKINKFYQNNLLLFLSEITKIRYTFLN